VKTSEGTYENKFICRKCNKPLSANNSTRSLRYHLTRHQDNKGKGRADGIEVPGQQGHGGGLVQSTLTGTSTTLQKKEAIIKAALTWVVTAYIPFSTFDSDSFRSLIRLINPIVNIPCTATIRDRLHIYRLGLQERIEQLLSRTFKIGSLTADDWTSDSNRPFMGITLHWLDSDFKAYECTLELVPHPYPHSGESIAKLISE